MCFQETQRKIHVIGSKARRKKKRGHELFIKTNTWIHVSPAPLIQTHRSRSRRHLGSSLAFLGEFMVGFCQRSKNMHIIWYGTWCECVNEWCVWAVVDRRPAQDVFPVTQKEKENWIIEKSLIRSVVNFFHHAVINFNRSCCSSQRRLRQ